jgi:hypothetical protein
MNQIWALYFTALALGAGHALEVDHMVAVTAFVGGRPRLGAAVGFGVRWGVGHSLAVLVAGSALALSGVRIPSGAQDWAELGVGVMLVALGIWAGNAARRLHVHLPQEHGGHAHLHAHAAGSVHHLHAHGEFHGLAGSAPVVALVPVTLMPSKPAAVLYLAMFGVGTIVGMAAYAALAAVAVGRVAASARLARAAAFATAGASTIVGLWWIATGIIALRA